VLRATLTVVAIAAVGALACLRVASAAPADPWIVFSASPNQGMQAPQLFRVRASGRGLWQVTSGRRVAIDPAFANDGRTIAFTRLDSGLFLVNVDGSGVRRLTANGSDRFPVYSPNGRRIAYIRSSKRAGYRVWMMNLNGRRQHRLRLAPTLAAAIRPAWMPDGRSLVIATGGAFYRISATTGRVQKEPPPTYDASLDPLLWSLSPNGKTIAYIGRRPEPAGCQRTECEVFALYLQGVRSATPWRAVADAGVAGWSRDGRRVAYVAGGGLTVQTPNGAMSRTIPIRAAAVDLEAPPAWQPR
jgi:Tol biopolymer transport system component